MAVFPLTVLFVSVSVPMLLMPRPPSAVLPPELVKPEITTVLPELILKMRLALLPLIVKPVLVGPLIVRFLPMSSSPVVNVIGLVT